VKTRQLPAYADQERYHKLDLMPIQVSAYSDIVDRYANIFAVDIFQSDAFIDDRAVSRPSLQSLPHRFRRSQDIVESPQLSKVRWLSEVKSEKIVPQRIGSEIQKVDLISNSETSGWIFDLAMGQDCLLQQRFKLNSRVLHVRTGEPGYAPGSARKRADVPHVNITHESASHSSLDR